MYIHQIKLHATEQDQLEQVEVLTQDLLAALRMNGQICGREWPLQSIENGVQATVLAPESDSFAPARHGVNVRKRLQQAQEAGIEVNFHAVAEDSCGAPLCACADPGAYLLYTHYLSLEAPLRCLDCFGVVPLYRMPPDSGGEYSDIICWQSDYQACDHLQMNCRNLEAAATRQLARLDSSLSTQGRDICRRLAQETGKPFYSYLYRAHARSRKAEMQSLCPGCKQAWYLPQALHEFLHFKCDACCLTANLAWNLDLAP